MLGTADLIRQTRVDTGSVAIFWLGQAGFAFKAPGGLVTFIDPYLTNSIESGGAWRRVMAPVMTPEEVVADLYVTTHEHGDHYDVQAIPIVARQHPKTIFAGPPTCVKLFQDDGISEEKIWTLRPGDHYWLDKLELQVVYADHGDLAPDAVGVILNIDGIRIYHMGDTALHIDKLESLASLGIDVLIPPINGRYGNLDSKEAAMATAAVKARVAIPSHYWLFIEHGGDPEEFMKLVPQVSPGTKPVLMTQGSRFMYSKPG